MRKIHLRCLTLHLLLCLGRRAAAQEPWTWGKVRARFEQSNPTLQAGKLSVDESKAQEITAYLRPNPTFTLLADGTQIAPDKRIWRPLAGTFESPSISYLHERQRKRELRLESAKKGTVIAESSHADLERTLLFNLRSAFVSTLQAKAVLQLARDDLAYYDHVLQISRDRFNAGDIAQIDLDRLELQRVQYESDLQTAEVNLRTAKIQLLTLLNDRTPVEQLDVTGPFDFNDQLMPRDEFRKIALDTRPDLKAAVEAVDKAKTDHKVALANGSIDPTLSTWYTHNSSNNNPFGVNTLGVSVGIPLRIFDRNQGEIVCDVYENDLGEVRLGDTAEIRLNAYPDKTYHGKVADISRVLDPATRTAKVRIGLPNRDGLLRPGMFAVATFRSRKSQSRIVVPSTAVIRLQDKDWVFRKEGPQRFRRVEVRTLGGIADGMQPIQGGLKAGEEIVANALEFSSAVAEQGK